MSSALWEQHTEKGHVPDGRALGPDADGASHPVSRRGGLRTKQEAADSQRGRGTAASASTGTHASLSLSGPPAWFLHGRGRRRSQIMPPPSALQGPAGDRELTADMEPSSGTPGRPLSTLTVLGRGVRMGRGAGTPRSPARPPEVAPCRWHRAEGAERDFTARGPLLSCLHKINLRWIKWCLVSGWPGLSDLSGGESAEEMDLISSGETLQIKKPRALKGNGTRGAVLRTHPRPASTGRRDASAPMAKGGEGAEGGGASGSPAAASNLRAQDSTPDTVLSPSPGPANSLTCSTARI